jgi:hypothetical protein
MALRQSYNLLQDNEVCAEVIVSWLDKDLSCGHASRELADVIPVVYKRQWCGGMAPMVQGHCVIPVDYVSLTLISLVFRVLI